MSGYGYAGFEDVYGPGRAEQPAPKPAPEPPPDLEGAALALAVRITRTDVDGKPFEVVAPLGHLWKVAELLQAFARAAVADALLRGAIPAPLHLDVARALVNESLKARDAAAEVERLKRELEAEREEGQVARETLVYASKELENARRVTEELRAELAKRPAIDLAKLEAWRERSTSAQNGIIGRLRSGSLFPESSAVAADLLESLQDGGA